MVTVAICDDEYSITSEIEELLFQIAKERCIKLDIEVYTDGSELEKDIKKGEEFDLIFLDIEMQQDGISTAKKIRCKGIDSLIIYISNYEKYLKELFEVDTFRFLSKPIDREKLRDYFFIALDKIQKDKAYFVYQHFRETRREKVKDILYFESYKRKIMIHRKDGEVLEFYGKLNDVERKISFENSVFLRTHQSFLVNSIYVCGWKNKWLELEGGIRIPISEEHQKNIREKYSDYIRRDIIG